MCKKPWISGQLLEFRKFWKHRVEQFSHLIPCTVTLGCTAVSACASPVRAATEGWSRQTPDTKLPSALEKSSEWKHTKDTQTLGEQTGKHERMYGFGCRKHLAKAHSQVVSPILNVCVCGWVRTKLIGERETERRESTKAWKWIQHDLTR